MNDLYAIAYDCLMCRDPAQKIALTNDAARRFARGELGDQNVDEPPLPIAVPGRPDRPQLVSPRDLPRRGLGTPSGRAALIHAVAHIEFNAINLAWDAVYRFRGMPVAYYADWLGVAGDEARHFGLLQSRLADYGHSYGDFPAHDGLWDMARRSDQRCLDRMALVPRVLEARGLDVTPGMIVRVRASGDEATAAILELILREEVAHVAAGSRWFRWCCDQAGLDSASTFEAAVRKHGIGAIRRPLNRQARTDGGFSIAEIDWLERLADRR